MKLTDKAEREAVRLEKRGLDGLYHPTEPCGCWIGDLYPCGERPCECRGGVEMEFGGVVGVFRPNRRRAQKGAAEE